MTIRPILFLGFALLTSCGGGDDNGSGATPTAKLLVACMDGGPNSFPTLVYSLTVASSGALSLVSDASTASAASDGRGALAVTRDSKLLYTNEDMENISAYQINPDGSLTTASSPTFATTDAVMGLAAHPAADLLYAISGSGTLSVLAITPDTGALELASSLSLGTGIQAGQAVITPDHQHLYASDIYTVGQTPTLQFLGFSIDSTTGALSAVPGNPPSFTVPSASYIAQMVVDPSGKFLFVDYTYFVSAGFDGAIAAFAIDSSSGALTTVPGSPFRLSGAPTSVAIDAAGKFLIASTAARLGAAPGNCLSVSSIDPGSGALAEVPGSPFGLVQSCGAIATDPSSANVYVGTIANTNANLPPTNIYVLTLDRATGALALTNAWGGFGASHVAASEFNIGCILPVN